MFTYHTYIELCHIRCIVKMNDLSIIYQTIHYPRYGAEKLTKLPSIDSLLNILISVLSISLHEIFITIIVRQ